MNRKELRQEWLKAFYSLIEAIAEYTAESKKPYSPDDSMAGFPSSHRVDQAKEELERLTELLFKEK